MALMNAFGIGDNELLAFVDFETTGLDVDKDHPIQVGIIFADADLYPVHELNLLVCSDALGKKIQKAIHEDNPAGWPKAMMPAYEVHGITGGLVYAEGLAPRESVKRVYDAVSAHHSHMAAGLPYFFSDNGHFDYAFMRGMFKAAGMQDEFPFDYRANDTRTLQNLGRQHPDYYHEEKPHDALMDCRITLRTYRWGVELATGQVRGS
jgi:oligoribonuclease (3'-5' exoribonuclease)